MYIFSKGVNATPFQALIFNEKLAEITTVYKRFFQSGTDTQSLAGYLRCFAIDGKVHFHIKDGLPAEIAKDCRRAFHSIFG